MNIQTYINSVDLKGMSEPELRRLAGLRAEFERLKRDGEIFAYEPQVQRLDSGKEVYQEAFHRSLAKIRWIFGGNKSGKSYATNAEAVWWLTGRHPYRKVPVPCRGWICSPDFPTSKAVSEKIVFKFMPKSMIKSWDKSKSILTLPNGSEVTFKSYDSGPVKFQGADLDFICFDEEPPYDIYEECLPRLLVQRGCMWCAETPTLGMTWTYDLIREMAGVDPSIEVFSFGVPWSKYVDQAEIEKTYIGLDEDTKKMRMWGEHIQLSGLIFKKFDKDIHVIEPFKIPTDWSWSRFRGIDHGLNNPTACVWVAYNRDGEVYIYDEYYENEKTIEENATAIKTISGGEKYEWSAIDGSTQSRLSTDKSSYYERYKRSGLICRPVYLTSDSTSLAINEVNRLMAIDEKTKRPKFFIFNTCYSTIKEMSRYRWKSFRNNLDKNLPEKPQEFMNHAITALFFVILSKARWVNKQEEAAPVVKPWYT